MLGTKTYENQKQVHYKNNGCFGRVANALIFQMRTRQITARKEIEVIEVSANKSAHKNISKEVAISGGPQCGGW